MFGLQAAYVEIIFLETEYKIFQIFHTFKIMHA